MATEVVMPKLGLTMEEGSVNKWLKKEGDAVQEGEPLMEVMTDKAAVGVESPASGVLRKIIVPEGETVPLATVIAVITDPDEPLPGKYAQGPASPQNRRRLLQLRKSPGARPQGRGAGQKPLRRPSGWPGSRV